MRQVTMLNVINILLKYYKKEKLADNIKKIIEAMGRTLYTKIVGKPQETYIPQKQPHIIDALCKCCASLKERFGATNCIFIFLNKTKDPNEWKESLSKVFQKDLELFFTEIKNFDKTAQQNREENKAGMQDKNQIHYYRTQINNLTPHLTIRLCGLHSKLGIPIFTEQLEQMLNCWNYMCKVFIKYLRLCERYQMNPFAKSSSMPIATVSYTSCGEEMSWDWLQKEDPDIVFINTPVVNVDYYIRETLIQATHYLAERVIDNPKYALKYFDYLINVFEKDCIDETTLIEIVKAARKVIMSKAHIVITNDNMPPAPYAQHGNHGNRSKLIGRLQERMPPGFEMASAELLNLTYDYLKGVTDVKDRHKKILNFTLIQLKNKSLDIRTKFFSLFDQYYGKTVYRRLQHIFSPHIWDISKDAKDSFWIQQALDLLLSSIDEDCPMQREPDGIVLLTFPNKIAEKSMTDVLEIKSAELKRIIEKCSTITKKLQNKKTKYWLRPLKDVTNWEYHICEKLWLKLFPQFWNLMTADEQQQIACLIEPFLTKDEFLKQMQGKRPNAIRTMFEAVAACDPLPKLAPEVIQYIGKNYGAWHTAIPLLESYLYAYPNNERFAICANILYKALRETDYSVGLQRFISKSSITHAALSYGQFGIWHAVNDVLSDAILANIKLPNMKESIKELEPSDFVQPPEDINKTLNQMDLRMWEDWQVEAACNLNTWENMKVPGMSINRMTLPYQYYKALSEWVQQKKITEESPMGILAQLYERIQLQTNEEDSDKENFYKRALKALFAEWNMLPAIADTPNYQSIIVQQYLHEITEFKTMIKESKDYINRNLENEFKSTLILWRERLPNKCESFAVWRDLLECRIFLFQQLKKKLPPSPRFEKLENYFHDIPWNYLKLAEVARKHQLIDQSLHYLEEADKYLKDTGDVHNYERFLRAKETAKICLNFSSEWNETEKYLKSVQKQPYCRKSPMSLSEITRLRGITLVKLEQMRDAYDELNSATTTCVHNYKAWESYAAFCENACNRGTSPKQYNVYGMKGYMNAAMYMLSKSKYYIPKILSCLERDNANPAASTGESTDDSAWKIFTEQIINLPTWVWMYWLPQLFTMLGRSLIERNAAKLILKNIAKLYPQPLYLYLQRITQELEKTKLVMTDDERINLTKIGVQEIWDTFKEQVRDQPKFDTIDKIMTKLEKCVLPGFNREDEFLLDLKNAFNNSMQIGINKDKLQESITMILEKYFGSNEEFEMIRKNYSDKFLVDFGKDLKNANIGEVYKRLRNWIDFLTTKVSLRTEQYSIDGYSQELASIIPKRIEMFGANYQRDTEPTPETTVYIARLETKVEKTTFRTRVDFRGNNEKTYNYYLQICNEDKYTETLIVQLRQFLNQLFSNSRHAMLRNVKLYSPYCLYWGKMKMSLDELHIISMNDLHEAALIERGYHPDQAIMSYLVQYFKSGLTNNSSEDSSKLELELRKKVFTEMKSLVGDYIFSGFIHKLVSNPDELFIYKKQFTSYSAAQAYFSYVFGINHKDLCNLMFCKRTGKIYYSTHDIDLIGEQNSLIKPSVPFRLTPNMQYFITPIGIEGLFAGAFTAAAYTMQPSKMQHLIGYLNIFYRDLLNARNVPDLAGTIQKNVERIILTTNKLVDKETMQKLFNARHAVFKTETVKPQPGGNVHGEQEEKKENEKTAYFNQEVYNKIKDAIDIEKLQEMPVSWASWF